MTRASRSYRACSTKRRTKEQIADIRAAIKRLLKADRPQTVRQVFYQLVVRDAIEKTENQYQTTVIRLLSEMRLAGEIPWDWIVDVSRRTRETQTFDNTADALEHTARYYRRSALREADVYIEIWSEKEALSGIIWDEASTYGCPCCYQQGHAINRCFKSDTAVVPFASVWDRGPQTKSSTDRSYTARRRWGCDL